MRKQKKTAALPKSTGFYDETLIEWRKVNDHPSSQEVYEAVNLADADYAMVAYVNYLGVMKWMFKVMDGKLNENNAVPPGVRVERVYSEVGKDTPIIVNAFNAQQLAIQRLNQWRAEQKARSDYYRELFAAGVSVTDAWGNLIADTALQQAVAPVAEVHQVGGITNASVAPPPVQAPLDDKEDLSKRFPRVRDVFGKEIPADDVAAAQTVPNPDALKPDPLEDELDYVP